MTIAVSGGTGFIAARKEGEFRVTEVPPGSALLVGCVTVFNVAGRFCATQAKCTHLRGPAQDPLETYQVTVEGEIGRIEAGAPAAARTDPQ